MTVPAIDLDAAVAQVLAQEEAWHAHPGGVLGEDTGLATLNRLIGGLRPGLTILGARTSHGKSALGMQIMLAVARSILSEWVALATRPATPPGRVFVFSPEMTSAELLERYATQISGVPIAAIRAGSASAEQRRRWREAAHSLRLLGPVLTLYAGDPISWGEIKDVLDAAAAEADAGVAPRIRAVFIDYLQRIHWGCLGSGINEYQALAQIVNEAKALANRLSVPLLIASQLNRAIERDRSGRPGERPPELSDLHGSGAIEAAADVVLLLWRPPEPQPATGALRHQPATILVRKNRSGPVGEGELRFWPALVSFTDHDRVEARKDGGVS